MSTRAYICMKTKSGDYRGIYNHWDGYLSGVGEILLNHYKDYDKVEKLINLGDISVLGQGLEPPKIVKKYGLDWAMNTEFNSLPTKEKVALKANERIGTIAYSRDRKEEKNIARWSNLDELYTSFDNSMIEFVYLFINNRWRYYDIAYSSKFKLLTTSAIKKELNDN